MKKFKIGGQFSGVGAFDQALKRLGIEYENIYQAEWDKYARQTYLHNYEEPVYYVKDVHDTPTEEITEKYGSLDIAMFSPPCQAFSLAGKRLGKEDQRGILFYNSHEFIKVNKPRYFIFENVKGLLSDNNGKTFQEWVNLLGGKSVNGDSVLFPYPDSVPYHLYWKVLNAKDYGVPQNRERVFLIGIRDDKDNNFRWPVEEHLSKKLKDLLEDQVDEKYFLSEKMINYFNPRSDNFNNGKINYRTVDDYATTITKSSGSLDISDNIIKIKSATSKGYEEAKEGDSINFSVPNSETRRGRVGKGVAQTLDTACNQAVMVGDYRADEGFRWREDGNSPTIMASMRDKWDSSFTANNPPIIQYNNSILNKTLEKHQLPEGEVKIIDSYNQSIHDNSITISTRVNASIQTHLWNGYKIRRLTPRECFRLMDFPDSLVDINNLLKLINNQGILLYLDKKSICQNVKQKDATEIQKQLGIVSCTTKDSKNTVTTILNSNIVTEEIQNAQLKGVINQFTHQDFAQAIITHQENTETLWRVSEECKKIDKLQSKELLNLMAKEDLESMEYQRTELYMKITLDENFQKMSAYTISIVILTIMNSVTYIYSLPKATILNVILNFKNLSGKSFQNLSKMEQLHLKMGNIKPISDSMLYKQAGNSIVVNVLYKIIANFNL